MATERVPWWQAVEQRRKTRTGVEITGAGHVDDDGWHGFCIMSRLGPIEAVSDPSIGNVDGLIQVQVDLPDPRGVYVDSGFLSHGGGHADLLVTTVGEMRGRTDLDQWEYADNEPGCVGWTTFARMEWREQDVPAGFPLVVRRKDGGS